MSSLERKRPREHDNHDEDDYDATTATGTTVGSTAPLSRFCDNMAAASSTVAAGGGGGPKPSTSSLSSCRPTTPTTPTKSATAGGQESLSLSTEALPPYGSQDYWEQRYAPLQQRPHSCNDDDGKTNDDDDNPDPFHAWYFNFEELAPIILPLILGDRGSNDGESEDAGEEEEEEEEEQKQSSSSSSSKDRHVMQVRERKVFSGGAITGQNVRHNTKGEIDPNDKFDCDDFDEDEDGDDEMETPPFQPGLAHKRPISVMEVGCGDVPLGRDLLAAILELEAEASVDASNIIKKVVCLDYSKNVIEAMRDSQNRSHNHPGNANQSSSSIPLTYEIADARNLPYNDATFDLILEKGTLDAMLSDRDGNGPSNCRKIIAECARVATEGGCIVVISHLNAHCQTGLQWLNDIVIPGLRLGAPHFEWSLEVHGNEADIPSEEEDNDEDGKLDSNQEYPESPGPAVYIIRKGSVWFKGEATPNDQDFPTIPLRFFSY
jgi:Methyltransferase domain